MRERTNAKMCHSWWVGRTNRLRYQFLEEGQKPQNQIHPGGNCTCSARVEEGADASQRYEGSTTPSRARLADDRDIVDDQVPLVRSPPFGTSGFLNFICRL